MNREVLDVIPRTRNQQLTGALIPGINVVGQADVGGSSGEPVTNLFIHGGDQNDQILAIDGMKVTEGGAGARRTFIVADNTVQEYTYETSAISAEIPTGGVRQNAVPKEGGNTFKGTVYSDFTTEGMTSDNLNAQLMARGLTSSNRVGKIFDIGPALGGPILRERLWFFGNYRKWGEDNLPAGAFYLYDPTRPAVQMGRFWALSARLTWQASARNKFNLYHEHQSRRLPYLGVSNLTPPEAATSETSPQLHLSQVKWTSPVTNKLLFQVAAYHYYQVQAENMSADSRLQSWVPFPTDPSAWPTFEVTTGKWVGGSVVNGTFFPGTSHASWWGESGSLSYITGSHAVKVGFTDVQGTYFAYYPTVPPILRLSNGVPFQIQLVAKPANAKNRLNQDLGLYGQDQWTLHKLTVNIGVRFDYFNGQVDPESAPASPWFLPARSYPLTSDVPNWRDVSPRIGVAYDVFGNGKTAVKTSISRYVASEAINFQNNVNPMGGGFVSGVSDTRTWTDSNHDGIPQFDEIGPSTNLAFGTGAISVRPADSVRAGWNARGHNWEYSMSVQQQLLARLSLMVGYYRRWFGNLTWTDNQAIQSGDFTPFTISSPLDGQVITMYNLTAAKRGLTNNVLTTASNDSNVFNGVDFLMNGHIGRGGTVGGGVTMGRSVTSFCTVATVDPNTRRFCGVTPPFMAVNQYKAMASYPLPYGIQVSGTFVSIPGPLISANYTVNSTIAGIPLTNGSLTVNLVQPGTLYGDRENRFDLRFGKNVHARSARLLPYIDLLNLFNASPVLTLNNTYGPTWQKPTTILPGRVVKLGVQVEF
jgi:hypothetical protein